MFRYAVRDLLRNPRRTLAAVVGVILGVGLFSGVLFFVDASGASMTQRALAPVDIDLQRVLTAPLGKSLTLTQRAAGSGRLETGQQTRVTLTVTNPGGAAVAHEVLIKDRLPAGLAYVRGSARVGGTALPDVEGQSPFSHGPGHIGHVVGRVVPGQVVRFDYLVRGRKSVADVAQVLANATVSSREHLLPIPANQAAPVSFEELDRRMSAIPGVASADQLAFAQLSSGSLAVGDVRVDRPLKVFGFDASYARHYPKVKVTSGSFRTDGALLSVSTARTLGVGPGDTVSIRLPGGAPDLSVPVSGIVDLSRARPLFNSREGAKLEDFLYVRDSVVLSLRLFAERVLPAFRQATSVRGQALAVKSPPTLEVDVSLDRSPLATDPAAALRQTQRIAEAVKRVAPGQDFVLDNASNTLTVAQADAAVAKKMFLFLGLPGLVLAGALAAYGGAVLAATQRREQALLRLRGANARHLSRMLLYRTAMLAGAGSLLGTLAGLLSCAVVLGAGSLRSASGVSLGVSALLSMGAGLTATGVALYLPSRRALGREVAGERRVMAVDGTPPWRRWRLDLVALSLTITATLAALWTGAFDAPMGNVSTGQATALRSQLLVLPMSSWLVGTLLGGRILEHVARNVPVPTAPRFGNVVRGLLNRTLSRRSRQLFAGIVGVGLVVAFGMGLAIFTATYDSAKEADARFTVGSDLRVTPSPLSQRAHLASYVSNLVVSGVAGATPVVASLENATMRSAFNSDVQDLVAIDPKGYQRAATPPDALFVNSTAHRALARLAASPNNLLVDQQTADGLKLKVGDHADVLMARGTKQQTLRQMRVAGLFTRFPGFPAGVQIVMNLDYYQAQTHTEEVDFFLVAASSAGATGLDVAVGAIDAGPGANDRLNIDTVETSLNKDQSSLTALNIRGLLHLDSFYTLTMSASVIAMFVIGTMLQRRKEYVVLTAQGLTSSRLLALLTGEAAFVAGAGLAVGITVGAGLGLLLVNVVKPLFILAPRVAFALTDVLALVGLVLIAMGFSVAAAHLILRSLSPSEVLREH